MKGQSNVGWTVAGLTGAGNVVRWLFNSFLVALLGALPVALAYVAFQRRVTQGFLAASGLKG